MLPIGLRDLLRNSAGTTVSICRMRVNTFVACRVFENTVGGKVLSVIEKSLAAGALQQLKISTQIGAQMVCGLVCSCVPNRTPVQSVYPTVHPLYPVLD